MAERQRTRLDPDLRRGQILSAASKIFREQEFSAVSLDAVADRAGVTRGLLHHYFGSKRGLYLAVVEQAVRIPESVQLMPEGTSGDLVEVLQICVDSWMRMIEATGGLWSGSAPTGGFAATDVDVVITAARDELVERMIVELPFPESLDPDLLRSALRAYAALARVVSEEWLVTKSLTREQTAAFLHSALVAMVDFVVPRMMEG
jgi:AcrR family transcriptional regulator